MARYGVTLSDTVTSGFLTAGNLVRGASKRAKVYDFIVGADGAPADTSLTWLIQRHNPAGTLSAIVAAPLDEADGAAVTTAGENATIEPTYTAAEELLQFPVNQRATYRWVAAPNGEMIIANTAADGIGWQVLSASYTGNAMLSIHFEE